MKSNWLILATLALLAAGCAPQVDLEAERAALLTADEAWSESAPDLDRFLSFYADDGSLLPPDAPVATGHEAIRAYLSGLFAAPEFALHWTTTKAELSRTGDLGYTYGTYELSFQDAEGNPVASQGKSLVVWKKQPDGQWKVVADMFNRGAPATPAAAD